MKNLATIIFCTILFPVLLSACGHHETRHYATHDSVRHAGHFGTVTDIDIVRTGSRTSGGGAVLGAIAGGVIGHQMGSGRGRDAATGIGAVGGAVAGNEIERRNMSDNEIYRVTVRFENGSRQKFDYREIDDLRVGDHVKVENGQIYLL